MVEVNPNGLYTLKQFLERHPYLTMSAMRAFVDKPSKYGMEKCFIKIGRKIVVNEAEFMKTLKNKE